MGAGSGLFNAVTNTLTNKSTVDTTAENPLGQTQVGYNQFRLNPTSGGKNYSTAFDVATGDTDYTKAAKVQAQGNLAAAQAQSAANRVNQINPYGSIQYYQSGVDAAGNPTYSAAASLSNEQQKLLNAQNQQSLGLANVANQALGNVGNTYGQAFNIDPYMQQMMGGGPQFSQYGGAPNMQMAGQGPQALQAGQAQQAQGIGGGEMAQRIGGGPQFQGLESANPLARAGQTDALQRSLGQNVGMEGWDRASNLLMQRLDPQLQRQQERQDAQLAAQGIPVGSEAYTRAKQDLAMQQNDARTQAQLAAQGIQQNLFGQELQAGQFGNQATTQQQQNLLQNLGFSNQSQQQDFANRQSQLAFNNQLGQQGFQNQLAGQQANNQAIAQNFGQGLSAQQLQNQAGQQNFTNQLAGLGFNAQQNQQGYQNQLAQQAANNAAQQQMFANQTNLTGLSNQDAQQMYQNQMAQQQANNMARQNNFQLASYLRGLPMQELNALRAGSQVTNPSFINVAQQGQTQGPDTLSAYQAQQNANIANQNRQAAQQSNLQSGLFNLGGSILGNLGPVGNVVNSVVGGVGNALGSVGNAIGNVFKGFSDPRLKENINRIGTLPNGLPYYSFEYIDAVKDHPLGGHGVHTGVMADEVEAMYPYAVETMDNGYKAVDYAKLP
jgi:hypothetical protein